MRRMVAVVQRLLLLLLVRMVRLVIQVARVSVGYPSHWRRVGSVWHRRSHPLLLLAPVAEPDAHHLFFELERVGQAGDLLGRRFGLLVEVLLESTFDGYFDRGALLALAALRGDLVDGRRRAGRRVGFFEPLLQQRFQLAHVFKTELERFEAADGGLREDVAVERAERQTDVGLREAEFNPTLFELFGERFQVVRSRVLLFGVVNVTVVVEVVVRVVRVTGRAAHLTVP